MFNTYIAFRNTNKIRAFLINEMNRNLFYSYKTYRALPTIPNQATVVDTVLEKMKAICYSQEHEFAFNSLYAIAYLISQFTNNSYNIANVIINEVPLEELQKQIAKEEMLGTDYVLNSGNLIRYTDNEKEINITINTSSLNIFCFHDNEEDGAYCGSNSAEYVYIKEINLKSGKQYKFTNTYDFNTFIADKTKYYWYLEKKQEEEIKAVYKNYWFIDMYSLLTLKKQCKLKVKAEGKLDIKQIIEYSDTLKIPKDILELETNKLLDELFIC